jgi:cobalt-zinc-cadmium efflux system outer membrane protein
MVRSRISTNRLAAWVFLLSVQGQAQGLELPQLVQLGLENNRELNLRRQELKTASLDTLAASTAVNPHLEIEAMHDAMEEGKTSGGVRLSREFQPGARKRHKKAAKADWEGRKAWLKADELVLAKRIRTTFYDWQILKRKAALQREVIERWEGLARLTTGLVTQGRLSEVDLAEAQLNAVKARQRELGLLSEIESKESQLRLLTGQAQPPRELELSLVDSLPPLPHLDTLLSWALASNPELAALQKEKAASRQRLAVEEGLALPAFTLSAGYERELEGYNMIGAGIELPLTLFNRNQVGIAKAGSGVRGADLRLGAAEERLKAEVTETKSRVVRLAERYGHHKEQVRDLGRKQMSLSEKGFRQGVTGIFDLSRVQKEALEQELEALELLRDYYQAFNELGQMVGGKVW